MSFFQPSQTLCSETPRRASAPKAAGFTRADLLAIVFVLGLLALAAGPALGGLKPRSDLAACANNLRQVWSACEAWGLNHDGERPWTTSASQGGTRGSALAQNAWYHFSVLSNTLASPRVLVCPSDLAKHSATDFSGASRGGFLNVGFRNNAVSYCVGTDCPSLAAIPTAILATDANLNFTGYASCSIGALRVGVLMRTMPNSFDWAQGQHYPFGNVLLNDGRVVQADRTNLVLTVLTGDPNGSVHLVQP